MRPFVLKSNMIALIFPFVLAGYTKCTLWTPMIRGKISFIVEISFNNVPVPFLHSMNLDDDGYLVAA
jgi:hypothetical protein